MSQRKENRTFGIIGLLLIIAAFVVWGFVIPQIKKSTDQKSIQNVMQTPPGQQRNPSMPTGESAMPRP